MLILLYGPDSYRRQEKLKEIIANYQRKHSSFALERFNLEQEGQLDKLKDFVKSKSLFDDLKLGIVSGGSFLEKVPEKEYQELLKENLKFKDPVLIILEDKKPAKDFDFLLENPALSQEFENLAGAALEKFLEQELKKRNLNLDSPSKNLLLQVYGGDSWRLITELDKLALLDEKKINLEVLEKHLQAILPINIFAAINQIWKAENVGQRLSLLEELFLRSKDAGMIFNLLSAFVKTSADKQKAADYDAAVKSGKLEYEEALTDLII